MLLPQRGCEKAASSAEVAGWSRRLLKNRFGPEEPTYGGNRIGEARLNLVIAGTVTQIDGVVFGMLVKDQTDNAVKTQQAWGGSQDRIGHALPGCLEPKVFTYLLEGCFNGPALRKEADQMGQLERLVRRVKELVATSASRQVAQFRIVGKCGL